MNIGKRPFARISRAKQRFRLGCCIRPPLCIPVNVCTQLISFLAEIRRNEVESRIVSLGISERARLDQLTLLDQFVRQPRLSRCAKRLERL